MWQLLLAAAVAGSGVFANRFLNPNSDPNVVHKKTDAKCDQSEEQQNFATPSKKPQASITLVECDGSSGGGSIFSFSSSGSRTASESKNARKKSRKEGRAEGFKSAGVEKVERKCGGVDRSWSAKKFAVCVKKRRTSRNAPGKCESCSSKDSSVFSWGLGVGFLYMISTGKAEIGRLNATMDETAKVVQELKTELHKRKSCRDLQFSSYTTETNANPDKIAGRNTNPPPQSSTENSDSVQYSSFLCNEGGSASSVLTEDPHQEVVEMDHLEAELEYELQKLPWCSTEISGVDGKMSDICEINASVEGFCKPDGQQHSSSYHLLASELDQKLCHLLIEQQERQIVDLESELHLAQSKLNEKEDELQAFKNCIRKLTEFSLANGSDEETEVHTEEEKINDKMTTESIKSMVGMKRALDFESYSGNVK